MAWVSENRLLTQAEMENNADIIISYYRSLNYSDESIASILGNMQLESTLSPILTEFGGLGYGLVQWTPVSKLQNHCTTLGYSPYTSGDVQLKVLDKELGTSSVNEWYTTSAFINNYISSGAKSSMINVTASEFKTNSKNFSVADLTILFMVGYERPSYKPNVNHIASRKQYAENWYQYMGGTPTPPPIPPSPPVPVPTYGERTRSGRRVVVFKKR